MDKNERRPAAAWGVQAAAAALATLQPVDRPVTTRSPLAQAVVGLAEAALGSSRDAGPGVAPDIDRDWFADVSLVLVDAVLARDKAVLDDIDTLFRRIHRLLVVAQQARRESNSSAAGPFHVDPWRCESWLQIAMEFVRSAQERVAPVAVAATIGGHAERFLRIVAERPGVNSRQIGQKLAAARDGAELEATSSTAETQALDEGQVSRLGRKLRVQGLVFAARGPNGLAWELTPRGRLVIDRLLDLQENADRPVDSMVIATPKAAPAEVAATLSEAEPHEVKVVRSEDVVVYQRRDFSPHPEPVRPPGATEPTSSPPAADLEDAEVTLQAAMSELFQDDHPQSPPPVFSLANGVMYEQIEYSHA